ncbi:MAG: Mut7-C RNAse domain-containing protein [Thermoplasmatota archaeon]
MERRATPRFLCDEMLKRLARWLRIMGYDVSDPEVGSDQEIIRMSTDEKRVILTRDKDLSNNRYSEAIRIISDDLDSQIQELLERFPQEEYPPGNTRCPTCNGELSARPPSSLIIDGKVQVSIPEDVIRDHEFVYMCIMCGKVYWMGSHWDGIRSRLDRFGAIPNLPG